LRHAPYFPRDNLRPLYSTRDNGQHATGCRRECPPPSEGLVHVCSARWYKSSLGRWNRRYRHRCNDGQMRNVLCPICASVSLQLGDLIQKSVTLEKREVNAHKVIGYPLSVSYEHSWSSDPISRTQIPPIENCSVACCKALSCLLNSFRSSTDDFFNAAAPESHQMQPDGQYGLRPTAVVFAQAV
jgi:hypothetical protein